MMNQCNVVQNGLCGRFNIKSLKKIMYLIGSAGLASNKQVLAENIIKQCKIFEQLEEDHYSARNNNEKKACTGLQVVAVDMGISNFSFTKFNLNLTDSNASGDNNVDVIPEITAWGKYDLSNVYEHILNPNYPYPYGGASCTKKMSSSSNSIATHKSTSVSNSNSNSNLKHIQFNPMTVNRLADEIIYDLLSESRSGSSEIGTPVVIDGQLQKEEKEQRNINTQKIKDVLSKTVFLFEHQRTRTLSSSNVLESVYRNSVLEYTLFTKLETYKNVFFSNDKNYPLKKSLNFQADPKKMCDYWIPNEITDKLKNGVFKEEKTSKSKISKKLRIKLVQNMFSQLQNKELEKFNQVDFQLSQSFVENHRDFLKYMDESSRGTKKSLSFYNALSLEKLRNGQKKDDDLCDSFLHGMAWIQWFRAYLKLKPVFLKNKDFCTNDKQLNNIIDSIDKEHKSALEKIHQYLLK